MEKQLTGDRTFSARAGSNSNKSRDEGTVGSTEDKVHSMSDPLSWGLKLLSHREGEKRREEESNNRTITFLHQDRECSPTFLPW